MIKKFVLATLIVLSICEPSKF
jgi:hypothetical protein